MKTLTIVSATLALQLAYVSLANAQSPTAPATEAVTEGVESEAVESEAVEAEAVESEPDEAEADAEGADAPQAMPDSEEPAAETSPQTSRELAEVDPPASSQVHLRFRAIRLYVGGALQFAPIDAPGSFETLCDELPCNADVDPGTYRLNVHRLDGRDYALPTPIDFSEDARISLKYGASTGAWVGGIVALTAVLGILISSGIAIAGAANDNTDQRRSGLIGLGVSSVFFGAGLVTFLMSERGLRAVVLD